VNDLKKSRMEEHRLDFDCPECGGRSFGLADAPAGNGVSKLRVFCLAPLGLCTWYGPPPSYSTPVQQEFDRANDRRGAIMAQRARNEQ
jgi:hypothetical protein